MRPSSPSIGFRSTPASTPLRRVDQSRHRGVGRRRVNVDRLRLSVDRLRIALSERLIGLAGAEGGRQHIGHVPLESQEEQS